MIPFNVPYVSDKASGYIQQALKSGCLAADGFFESEAESYLSNYLGRRAYLTGSCTASLEMAALLLDIQAGDEVIIPAFTFVSTANSFLLRSAKIVFVDISPNTLCLDYDKTAIAITERTKAIVVVHYGGACPDIARFSKLAKDHNIALIEDAAQSLHAYVDNRPVGSFGDISCISFHETKNIGCGQGGLLSVSSSIDTDKVNIIRDKGTDRALFKQGVRDKYSWCGLGSSYRIGEVNAAFLKANLEDSTCVTKSRITAWNAYYDAFEALEHSTGAKRPIIQTNILPNAHVFYLILNSEAQRNSLIKNLASRGIHAYFHYIPLDRTPLGKTLGYEESHSQVSNSIATRLLRLPLYEGVLKRQESVIDAVYHAISN